MLNHSKINNLGCFSCLTKFFGGLIITLISLRIILSILIYGATKVKKTKDDALVIAIVYIVYLLVYIPIFYFIVSRLNFVVRNKDVYITYGRAP